MEKIIAHIPLENENQEWIKKEGIDIGEFARKLIKDFYENMKSISKKTAF